MRLNRDAHSGVATSDLFQCDAVRQKVRARTTMLLGERKTQQAELAHLAYDLVRERRGAVHLLSVRLDLGFRKISAKIANHLLLVAEREIHREAPPQPARISSGAGRRAARGASLAAPAPPPTPARIRLPPHL